MIANRIASTAALATFGLAALGGIALAAPGNADTGSSGRSSGSSSHAGKPAEHSAGAQQKLEGFHFPFPEDVPTEKKEG